MKKLLKMFTVVVAVALLSATVVSVYATSVLSSYKSETVFGITYTFASQLISTDSYMAAYSPLFSGKEYRAVVMIYVEDATGTSTQQLTSKTVTS